MFESSSTMTALERLGLHVISLDLPCIVTLIRRLVCSLTLARVIVLATFQYFQVLALIFVSNLESVFMKICHKHHLFSSC